MNKHEQFRFWVKPFFYLYQGLDSANFKPPSESRKATEDVGVSRSAAQPSNAMLLARS